MQSPRVRRASCCPRADQRKRASSCWGSREGEERQKDSCGDRRLCLPTSTTCVRACVRAKDHACFRRLHSSPLRSTRVLHQLKHEDTCRSGYTVFLLLWWLMNEAHSRQYGCNRKVLKVWHAVWSLRPIVYKRYKLLTFLKFFSTYFCSQESSSPNCLFKMKKKMRTIFNVHITSSFWLGSLPKKPWVSS